MRRKVPLPPDVAHQAARPTACVPLSLCSSSAASHADAGPQAETTFFLAVLIMLLTSVIAGFLTDPLMRLADADALDAQTGQLFCASLSHSPSRSQAA